MNRLSYGRYLDVLVAHSPPLGIHDKPDLPHRGFKCFLDFTRIFKPRYLLHGHIHIYRNGETTRTRYLESEVINVYPYRILDLVGGPNVPERQQTTLADALPVEHERQGNS